MMSSPLPRLTLLLAIALLSVRHAHAQLLVDAAAAPDAPLLAAAASDGEPAAIVPAQTAPVPAPTPGLMAKPEITLRGDAPSAPAPAAQPDEASGAAALEPGAEFDRSQQARDASTASTSGAAAEAARQAVAATPTGNVVVNLINKLVEKGVLTSDDARTMVAEAQAEAETQRAQSEADMFAIAQVAAVQTMTDQALAEQQRLSPLEAAKQDMSQSVTYIPAPVRAQITEDIKRELGLSVGGDNAKPPPGLPSFLAMLKPEGEIRMRYEADLYPSGNNSEGAFPNFNAINTGAPFDVTGFEFAPQWNTDQDRNRFRLLARFGVGIDFGDNFSGGIRLGTGQNNSPVSSNQSMGLANQEQGGNFSDYAIWLERAYIRYDLGGGEDEAALAIMVGRFDNPFFSTPLIFDNDLGFDGGALRLSYNYRNVIIPSVVAGAFPVFNTELNFASNAPEKFPSYDKYLFAIQGGTQINLTRNWSTQLAAAYYYFYNIEGQLSSPFYAYTENDQGDTDNSRPSFAQKGNTYFPIRDIIADAYNDYGAINQWQYYGLATPFQNLAFTGRLSYDGFEPVRVSLIGEFIQNLAFDKGAIDKIAVNNRGEVVANDSDINTQEIGAFEGSGTAWLVDLEVGHAELDKFGAWQVSFGYRWIGSDAVVDGFNDSGFGLGGTNMKGFTAAARMALNPHVYLALRWFGSESIAGPQYDMNIFQFDVGAQF
jgi:polyhydroxyalkanoate synthesis regulator phasin